MYFPRCKQKLGREGPVNSNKGSEAFKTSEKLCFANKDLGVRND